MADEAVKHELTQEGYDEKQEELHYRTVIYRAEIAQRIKEAREQGDLSENAEYDAARDEQRENERKISELEEILKNVKIVGIDNQDTKEVKFGCTVKFEALDAAGKKTKERKTFEYKIVGSKEADILSGKVSNESPVGKGLLGATVGQVVTIDTPNAPLKYKVLDFWSGKKPESRK